MISDIALLTCNRPSSLSLALEHSIRDSQRLGRSLRWHVFDDARELPAVGANRNVVEELRSRFGVRISHVTRDDRQRWVDALVREGRGTIAADVARLALVGPEDKETIGANRNAITLSLLGREVLCMDDDVVPTVKPMPGQKAGIRFEPKRDPTEFHFFKTREQAIASLSTCDQSLVEAHEVLLGRTETFPPEAGAEDGPARVVFTMAGLAGDSAMGGMLYYTLLEGDSRARWVADYPATRMTREVIRGVTTATFSGARLLMGANLGMDLGAWLPPFVPVGRNEEGPVSLALRIVTPECYIGHVPYVVVHSPPESRFATFAEAIASMTSVPSSHGLMYVMGALPRRDHQTDPAARSARLGRFLVDMCEDADALDRLVKKAALQAQEIRLSRLENALASRTNEPDAWVRDLTQFLRAGEAAMARPEYTLPADLPGTPEQKKELLRARIRSYGRVFTQWLAMRSAAAELQRKGKGLLDP